MQQVTRFRSRGPSPLSYCSRASCQHLPCTNCLALLLSLYEERPIIPASPGSAKALDFHDVGKQSIPLTFLHQTIWLLYGTHV